MPTFLFKHMGLGSPRPTIVILQLIDRSLGRPDKIVEDVLVQMGSHIFPMDCIILYFDAKSKVPFILGHPYVATGCGLVDVVTG